MHWVTLVLFCGTISALSPNTVESMKPMIKMFVHESLQDLMLQVLAGGAQCEHAGIAAIPRNRSIPRVIYIREEERWLKCNPGHFESCRPVDLPLLPIRVTPSSGIHQPTPSQRPPPIVSPRGSST